MKFGIIGAGLIGKKRATAFRALGHEISGVYDVHPETARRLADSVSAPVCDSLDQLLSTPDLAGVCVATSNDALAGTVLNALRAGKPVLVEKPGGRNPAEVLRWKRLSEETGVVCRVGFNHRFHPALLKAKGLLAEGAIGELMYLRGRYGHGGRLGYEKEWRADPEKGGGGELIDQGVHLIDLCRWFAGDLALEFGRAETFFWNMPVEDNGFLLLKSPHSKVRAWLHASCTEWKNTFELEIYGQRGKIQIVGLGRSYGPEELRLYRVKPEMGVPDQENFTFPEGDISWEAETSAFIQAIALPHGNTSGMIAEPNDALRAVELVYEVYRDSGMSWIS